MVTIDVSELNQLSADLGAIITGRVGAKVSAAIRKTALDIERDAKAFAPVDTGTLRSSISTEVTGDGRHGQISAEIGPTAAYGIHVEFGTSRTAPQAFMGPAFDRHANEFVTAVDAITRDLL